MPVDFNSQELLLLLRQMERGNAILFAGAGFSLGARNRLGGDPPLGTQLARELAHECGWVYADEELGVVYEQAQKHLGTQGLRDFLNIRYRDCVPAQWHRLVARTIWRRIYTTNIDDVIEEAFIGSGQRLRRVVCPANYEDADPWYESVQGVHLNGCVLEPEKGFTFSAEEYAEQTAKPNPWYQAFTADMQGNSVVFVGTKLNEPPMYHYLSLRAERNKGVPETRAKAFVVSPGVSPIRRRQLDSQGYVVVDARAEDFFPELYEAITRRVPTRTELLINRFPHQVQAIAEGMLQRQGELLRYFEFLQPGAVAAGRRPGRELFYEGVEPTWDDIAGSVDAERAITSELREDLKATTTGVRTVALVGHAGSGKTTAMKRVAYELAADGRAVYVSKAAQVPDRRVLLDFLSTLGDRHVFIFIDDAASCIDFVEGVAAALGVHTSVTFVLVDRPHVIYSRLSRMRYSSPKIVEMPALNKQDCERIIDKLQEFGLLGNLRGMPRADQIRQFLGRSRKQLLVALKEATSGRGFDAILTDEFQSLSGENARLAYLVASLAYMHGAPVRRRHLIACIDGTDLEKGQVLQRDLREVILPWRDSDEFFSPRHRIIAHDVATEISSPGLRAIAVVNFLSAVSADVTPQNITRRTPEYVAYRGIINFDNMLDLFGEDYEMISGVYGSLKDYYRDDFLFWLQFGRSEVYFDNFTVAENYLNQSLGIRAEGNFQAWHNLGVLFLKRARYDANDASAEADARHGEEILREQIRERGDRDAYPMAALIKHKYLYLSQHRSPKFRTEVEELAKLAQKGLQKHPLDQAMQECHQEIWREYLMLTVSDQGTEAHPEPES